MFIACVIPSIDGMVIDKQAREISSIGLSNPVAKLISNKLCIQVRAS